MKSRGWSLWAVVLLLVSSVVVGQALPQLRRYATDTTGTLSSAQLDALDTRLQGIDAATGSQVVVLIVPDTAGLAIEDYSHQVAASNQIGRKKLNDGVLVLVAKNDRKARIEVGYGLEGAIPDATAWRLIQEYMVPKFRTGDYAGGIDDTVTQLDKLIRGEQLPAPVAASQDPAARPVNIMPLVFGFFAAMMATGVLSWLPRLVRALGGAVVGGGVAAMLGGALVLCMGVAVAGFLMGLVRGTARFANRGGWGGGGPFIGGGGFGGGGFGGGGFGGGGGFSGGGGSFGGGGASGSW